MREFERAYLKRVVQQARGRRGEAANLLGISRKNLWEKLRGYGFTEAELTPQDARK
jgi:two-component system response regulator HydG/two-component system response regulator AtoC